VSAEDERLWVLLARKGDQDAFAKLVGAYQGPVYNLAYRMLGSQTEAEDAAQETFLRAYTRLGTYDPQRKFSSWMLSIASHYCIDRLRRRRGGSVSMEEIQSWRWIPDRNPRPEERALDDEKSRLMHQVLDRMPPQYRLVIVLRYWYELSYDEIAKMTDSTNSAVKSRLHRARRLMAERLTGNESAVESMAIPLQQKETENAVSGCF